MSLISDTGYLGQTGDLANLERFRCLVVYGEGRKAEELAAHAPHVVQISNRHPSETLPQVLTDDGEVGKLGAEYLLGLGYRKLVFLSRRGLHYAAEREDGFVEAVRAAGAELHILRNWTQDTMPGVARALLDLGKDVAVMASNDLDARWLIEAFDDPESVVPERVAVLGVDDDPLENNLSAIPISSIRLPGERIGYEAAALGMRLADGESVPEGTLRIAPIRVVVRQSTSKLAISDETTARALRIIRDNIGEIQSVPDLCKAMKVERRPMELRFNRILNSSIARELTNARIQRAKELLANSDLSIKEIAYLVGYTEPRRLSIAFRSETGERPVDFRNRVLPMR
jgi:LacI family transcriptional regulator